MTALIRTRHGQPRKGVHHKNPTTPGQNNASDRKRFIQELKRQNQANEPFIGRKRFLL